MGLKATVRNLLQEALDYYSEQADLARSTSEHFEFALEQLDDLIRQDDRFKEKGSLYAVATPISIYFDEFIDVSRHRRLEASRQRSRLQALLEEIFAHKEGPFSGEPAS